MTLRQTRLPRRIVTTKRMPWEAKLSKRLLSLDIGITTGYAVHNFEGELLEYGEITEHALKQEVARLRDQYKVSRSVAERPIIIRGRLGDRLAKLIFIVESELMRQVQMIDSAQWKPSPSKKHPTPQGTSTHVKDAIRIGHWYLGRL